MNALQIALALAVSMLIFSTLATMVVEMFHKLLGSRRRGLKKMLEAFYENEVKQRLQALIQRGGVAVEDMPEFIQTITLKAGDTSVTTIEFVRRLADTEIGKRIGRRADNEVDVLIDGVAERYEEYGRQASQLFRRYSQIGTVVVSMVVALCLNINVLVIFRTFQSNETLTRTVALQAQQAMATYKVQAEILRTTQTRDSDITAVDMDLDDLKASVKKFNDALAKAEKLGLPIGWSDDKIFNASDIEPLGWFVWTLTTLLTGFLIGLGGPFWYDVVKRLTPVTQLAGALVRPPPATDDAGKRTTPKKSGPPMVPEDPKIAFKTAIRANRILDTMDAETGGFLGPKALRL